MGVLHMCVNRTRYRTFTSDARAIFAQSCGYLVGDSTRLEPSSVCPNGCSYKRLSSAHSPHCGECAGHLFASQLQRTTENSHPQVCARAGLERCPPAHNMGELSRRARTPARLRIRSVHATEVFCQPRSAHIARTPINLFNCHCRR